MDLDVAAELRALEVTYGVPSFVAVERRPEEIPAHVLDHWTTIYAEHVRLGLELERAVFLSGPHVGRAELPVPPGLSKRGKNAAADALPERKPNKAWRGGGPG